LEKRRNRKQEGEKSHGGTLKYKKRGQENLKRGGENWGDVVGQEDARNAKETNIFIKWRGYRREVARMYRQLLLVMQTLRKGRRKKRTPKDAILEFRL